LTSFINWIGSHWKVSGLILVVTLASISSVYAYWRLSGTQSSSPVSTITWYPVELRVELEKTEFQQEEPIQVDTTLRNIGNVTIEIVFQFYEFDYNVTDVNNNTVYQWSYDKVVQVIVGFWGEPNETLIEAYGGKILRNWYPFIPAIVCDLTEGVVIALRQHPNVEYVCINGLLRVVSDQSQDTFSRSHFILKPSEEISGTFVWNQTDNNGNQVSKGAYKIGGSSPYLYLWESTFHFCPLRAPSMSITIK